ncbi:hypothetical protein NQ314_017684, partial [Rhamnusium bicolor]
MRKVICSKRSGTGMDDVYDPTLWYYKLLLFTKDQEQPEESIENLEEVSVNSASFAKSNHEEEEEIEQQVDDISETPVAPIRVNINK